MVPNIIVVIRRDPLKTHHAVEALRIALGLGASDNPLTIVLLDNSPLLLTSDTESIVDNEILEKYLPSFKQLRTPFLVPEDSRSSFEYDDGFFITEVSLSEMHQRIAHADRVLVF